MSSLIAPLLRIYQTVPPPIRGMALMMTAAILNMCMASILKILVKELPVFEVAFLRHLFGTMLLLPLLLRPGANPFRTQRLGMHGLRALLNIVAILAYFTAVGMIPLTQVTALGFTSPLFASLFAVMILGEVMRRSRVIGLALGLVGAVIILRPGFQEISPGAMLALSSALFWAGAMTCIKSLSRTDSSVAIVFYAAFLQLPIAFVLTLFVWQMPTPAQFGLTFVIAIIGTLAQLSITQAFREADATVVLPMDFTKLIWASLLGYLLFSELPDIWAWIGGAVVFSGVLWVGYSEARDRKARAAET
jgi:drug/metabolite transporter (DMT)-like permease